MRTFLRNLVFALNGIGVVMRTERHFQYHLVAALLAFTTGFILSISPIEWLFVSSAVFSVLTAESMNTAIEELCNEITMERKPSIKIIKDIAAGAVLLSVFYSLITALVIFLPKILSAIQGL